MLRIGSNRVSAIPFKLIILENNSSEIWTQKERHFQVPLFFCENNRSTLKFFLPTRTWAYLRVHTRATLLIHQHGTFDGAATRMAPLRAPLELVPLANHRLLRDSKIRLLKKRIDFLNFLSILTTYRLIFFLIFAL